MDCFFGLQLVELLNHAIIGLCSVDLWDLQIQLLIEFTENDS